MVDKYSEYALPKSVISIDSDMFVYQYETRRILIDYLIRDALTRHPRNRTMLEICLITSCKVKILMNKRYLLMNTVEINQKANVFGTYLKCVYFQSHIVLLIN